MSMTSDFREIERLTDLKIGKVFLGEETYISQKEGDRIFDKDSGNFHLVPVIEDEKKCRIWAEFFGIEKAIRNEVINLLASDESLEVYEGSGKSGVLGDIPQFYKAANLNHFFRYIQVRKGARYYFILFKRFYIDKDHYVNCKYGEIQFYTSLSDEINEKIGDKWQINYPQSYMGQNEKMIRLSNTKNRANGYNPKGLINIMQSNIEKSTQFAESIVKKFGLYIGYIEENDALE